MSDSRLIERLDVEYIGEPTPASPYSGRGIELEYTPSHPGSFEAAPSVSALLVPLRIAKSPSKELLPWFAGSFQILMGEAQQSKKSIGD